MTLGQRVQKLQPLGGLAGVALGFGCGVFPGFGRAVGTTAEFLRPMPSVALIPIGILFLGLGFGLCVAVAAFACCWPAYVAARAGAGAAGLVCAEAMPAVRVRAARLAASTRNFINTTSLKNLGRLRRPWVHRGEAAWRIHVAGRTTPMDTLG